MKPRCKHGHLWTEKNTRWAVHSVNGSRYRACRTCNSERMRLRYRRDPEYRDSQILAARARYHAGKENRV
jgi:hypothetical protein